MTGKNMKKRSYLLLMLAAALSHGMCACVAWRWRDLLCGAAHEGYSAPAWTALLYAIPLMAAIAVCVALALIPISRKHRKSSTTEEDVR